MRLNEKQQKSVSKFLSLILRHRPEQIGITLDKNGWVDIDILLAQANHPKHNFTVFYHCFQRFPYQKTASVFVPRKGIPQNRLKSNIAQRHRLVSYITAQRKNRCSRYLVRDCMQVHAISSIFRQISKLQSKSVPDMANPSY